MPGFAHAQTKSVSATTTSGNVAFTGGGITAGHCWVYNVSSVVVFVKFGTDNTVAATSGDMPVLPNQGVLLAKPVDANYAAAITASSTATVYFAAGSAIT